MCEKCLVAVVVEGGSSVESARRDGRLLATIESVNHSAIERVGRPPWPTTFIWVRDRDGECAQIVLTGRALAEARRWLRPGARLRFCGLQWHGHLFSCKQDPPAPW